LFLATKFGFRVARRQHRNFGSEGVELLERQNLFIFRGNRPVFGVFLVLSGDAAWGVHQ
jgi:hypothetical protein